MIKYHGSIQSLFPQFFSHIFIRIKRNTCRVAPEVANLTRECSQQTRLVDEDSEDYCNAWEESTELTR